MFNKKKFFETLEYSFNAIFLPAFLIITIYSAPFYLDFYKFNPFADAVLLNCNLIEGKNDISSNLNNSSSKHKSDMVIYARFIDYPLLGKKMLLNILKSDQEWELKSSFLYKTTCIVCDPPSRALFTGKTNYDFDEWAVRVVHKNTRKNGSINEEYLVLDKFTKELWMSKSWTYEANRTETKIYSGSCNLTAPLL